MYAIAILVLAVLALAAAKNLPALLVLGIVTVLATVLRRQTVAAAERLLGLGAASDPWATPGADSRRLMKRSLKLALDRTELASCFPGRGL